MLKNTMKKYFPLVSIAFVLTTACSSFIANVDTIRKIRNEQVFWEHYPLYVIIDPRASDWIELNTIMAIDAWNEAAGYEVLIYKGRERHNPNSEQTIYIYEGNLGKNNGRQVEGITVKDYMINSSGDLIIYNCKIKIWRKVKPVFRYVVLTHELGHALGLQHVRNRNSIMYPFTSRDTLNSIILEKHKIFLRRFRRFATYRRLEN